MTDSFNKVINNIRERIRNNIRYFRGTEAKERNAKEEEERRRKEKCNKNLENIQELFNELEPLNNYYSRLPRNSQGVVEMDETKINEMKNIIVENYFKVMEKKRKEIQKAETEVINEIQDAILEKEGRRTENWRNASCNDDFAKNWSTPLMRLLQETSNKIRTWNITHKGGRKTRRRKRNRKKSTRRGKRKTKRKKRRSKRRCRK